MRNLATRKGIHDPSSRGLITVEWSVPPPALPSVPHQFADLAAREGHASDTSGCLHEVSRYAEVCATGCDASHLLEFETSLGHPSVPQQYIQYCRADDPPASFRVLCSCIILKTDYPFFFAATACDSVTIYAVAEHIEREAQPIRIYRVPHHIHRVVVP